MAGIEAADGVDDDTLVVIPLTAAKHLQALADALLRNGESGAFKAYVEVPNACLRPQSSALALGGLPGYPLRV